MDVSFFTTIFQEFLFVLVIFSIFFAIALRKGRQTVINIIFGLYIGLLLTLQFPYYDELLADVSAEGSAALYTIIIFAVFSILGTWLFTRVLPREYSEGTFEAFLGKLALAISGTILIVLFSHHVIPVQELINITTPLSSLFASTEYFFWWLLVPLITIFWVN